MHPITAQTPIGTVGSKVEAGNDKGENQQPAHARFPKRFMQSQYGRFLSIATLLGALMLVTTAACPIYGQGESTQCPLYPSPHLRMGVNVAREGGVSINDYDAASLHAGWYHDYNQQLTPSHPGGMLYHQMLRTTMNTTNLTATLGSLVDANPGAIWVLGNEPDRNGQDEMTPAEYAVFYHDVYSFLKERDPTSRVAVGAIVQPTPIRLRYLTMMLDAYEARYGERLPTDLWTLHNFQLPERCNWGADIPPGLEAFASEALPCLVPLSKHGDLATFEQRIRDFRLWMKEHGYREYPLVISEYGILLAPIHGFTYPVVREYMTATFDYMLNTTDSELGYPADSNRLVQQFAWFSLNYYAFNATTPNGLNGNLFDHDSGLRVELGNDYANYAAARVLNYTDLQFTDLSGTSTQGVSNVPVTLRASLRNGGGVAATNVALRFWLGEPENGGTLLGTVPVAAQVLPDCGLQYAGQLAWTPPAAGNYTIVVDLQADNLDLESNLNNNRESTFALIAEPPTATPTGPNDHAIMPMPAATPSAPAIALRAQISPRETPLASIKLLPTATPTVSSQSTVTVGPGQAGQLHVVTQTGMQVTVAVGANAVDQPTTLEISASEFPQGVGTAFLLVDQAFNLIAKRNGSVVADFVFQNPIVIAVTYSGEIDNETTNPLPNEDEIFVYNNNETQKAWQKNGITLLNRDIDSNCLQVIVSHVGEFALLMPNPNPPTPTANQLYLPVIVAQ